VRPIWAFIRSVHGTLSLTVSVYVGLMLPEGFPELLLLILLCTALYLLMRVPRASGTHPKTEAQQASVADGRSV